MIESIEDPRGCRWTAWEPVNPLRAAFAVNLDGLIFYKKYGLNAGILLSRLDRLRGSNFTAVRDRIIAEWGPGARGLLRLGDQARTECVGLESCCPADAQMGREQGMQLEERQSSCGRSLAGQVCHDGR